MHTFTLIFLAALAIATAVKLWLGLRHIRHVAANREAVPAELAGEITPDAHRKAADYSNAKTRLGLCSTVFEAGVVLALTFGGVPIFLYLIRFVGRFLVKAPRILQYHVSPSSI